MSTEELKHLLTEMADEVKPTQLHKRAIEQSRRTGIRTALVAGVATLAVLAGGLAGAVVLTGGDAGPDSAPPGHQTGADDGAKELTGRFYGSEFSQPSEDFLLTWQAGDKALTEVASSDDPFFVYAMNVSPDGRRASWIDKNGHVHVRDLQSGMDRRLADRLDLDSACAAPVWAPDSRRLFVKLSDERAYFWDAETEEATAVAAPRGCQVRVATDAAGEDLLFSTDKAHGDVEVYLTGADGRPRETPLGEAVRATGQHVVELTAVSPDGRFACLGADTAPDHHETLDGNNLCTVIAEIDTGRILDIDGDWFGTAAVFDEPGRLIVTMGPNMSITLRAMNGEILDEVAAMSRHPENEPPELLRYVAKAD